MPGKGDTQHQASRHASIGGCYRGSDRAKQIPRVCRMMNGKAKTSLFRARGTYPCHQDECGLAIAALVVCPRRSNQDVSQRKKHRVPVLPLEKDRRSLTQFISVQTENPSPNSASCQRCILHASVQFLWFSDLLSTVPELSDVWFVYKPSCDSSVQKPESLLHYGPGETITTYRDQERVVIAIADKAKSRLSMIEGPRAKEVLRTALK